MAKPFRGSVIALSGTFSLTQGVFFSFSLLFSKMSLRRLVTNHLNRRFFSVDNLKQIIEGGGGTFSSKVNDECTHLVTTLKAAVNTNTKCEFTLGSKNMCQLIYIN